VESGPFQSKPQHQHQHPLDSSTDDVRLVVSAPTENIRGRLSNKDDEAELEEIPSSPIQQRPSTCDGVCDSLQKASRKNKMSPCVLVPTGTSLSMQSSGYVSQEALFGSDPLSPKKLFAQTAPDRATRNGFAHNGVHEVSFV